MANKFQEAFNIITDYFHSYCDDKGTRIHERHITKEYEDAKKTLQELIDKYTFLETYMKENLRQIEKGIKTKKMRFAKKMMKESGYLDE